MTEKNNNYSGISFNDTTLGNGAFSWTQSGLTLSVSASPEGFFTNITSGMFAGLWLSSNHTESGIYTLTFSQPVNAVEIEFEALSSTGGTPAETISNFTVSSGSPIINYSNSRGLIFKGQSITTNVNNGQGVISITSPSPFTSVSFLHNQNSRQNGFIIERVSIPKSSPIDPLQVDREFTFNSTTNRYELSGNIQIGLKGDPFQPLVTLQGSMWYDNNSKIIHAEGIITSNIGSATIPLFEGNFEINIGQASTNLLKDISQNLTNKFKLGGLEINFDKLAFVNNQIELQGSIKIPAQLGGGVVKLTDDDKLTISSNGVAITGGSLKLPGKNKFVLLDLLEIETKNTEIAFDFANKKATLQGKFLIPTLNNTEIDLSKGKNNGVTIKETESGLDFEWQGTIDIPEITLFEQIKELKNLKFKNIFIEVDSVKKDISATAQFTTPQSSFDLNLEFQGGKLKNFSGTSPKGTDFTWIGIDVDLQEFDFLADRDVSNTNIWEPELKAKGLLKLPQLLSGLEIAVQNNDRLVLNNQEIYLDGVNLKLPGNQEFVALNLLKIKTKNARLDVDSKQKGVKLQGDFLVSLFGTELDLDLTGKRYIAAKQSSSELLFAMAVDISVDEVPIFGLWKLKDVKIDVKKSFEDSFGSASGIAKLITPNSSVDLELSFQEGQLAKFVADMPGGIHFTWLGVEVNLSKLTFIPDINLENEDLWEPQIEFQEGSIVLPSQLSGLQIDLTGNDKFILNEDSFDLNGASLKLQGKRTFTLFNALEIQTKDVEFVYDRDNKEAKLQGLFTLPSFNNFQFDLTGKNHITLRDNNGLQLAMAADVEIDELPIYGDWKLRDITIDVKKTFEDDVRFVSKAKLITSSETINLDLTFANGRLDKATAKSGVGNDFSFLGMTFDLRNLTFLADINRENDDNWEPEFAVQGVLKLPSLLSGATVEIINSNWLIINENGFDITGGKITLPDFTFNLAGGFKVNAQGLNLEYSSNPNKFFKIQGKVSIPTLYNAVANFAGNNYIKIDENGNVDAVGFVSAENIVIVPKVWEIQDAKVTFGAGGDITGEGTILIPTGIEVAAGIGFVNNELNYIKLAANNLNKPIATTGLFLQKIGGQVNNIATSASLPAQFDGELGLTAGVKIQVSLPSWAGGGFSGSLVELDLNGSLNKDRIKADGSLKILGGILQGNGEAELNWNEGFLRAQANFQVLGGLISTNSYFQATSNLDIRMSGEAKVILPNIFPWYADFLNNLELASANFLVEFSNDNNYGNDFVAAWGKVPVLEQAGFKVFLNGDWEFINAQGIEALPKTPQQTTPQVATAANDDTPIIVTVADSGTSNTITTPIINDTKFKGDETINFALTDLAGGTTIGSQSTDTITINSEDLPQHGTLAFKNSQFSVDKNGTPIIAVTVVRTDGSDGEVSVTLIPSDGTAIGPNDYNSDPISLIFADGETAKTVTIPLIDNGEFEGSKTINLALSNPTGDANVGTQNTATLAIINNPTWIPIYNNNFETSAGEEWSDSTLGITPVGERKFLGQFGNGTVSLSLNDDNLINSIVSLELDLFIINSWDGNHLGYGTDFFNLSIENGETLLNTTFSNTEELSQSYPDAWGTGDYPSGTGAIEIDTLNSSEDGSAVYHLVYTFPYSQRYLTLDFSGLNLEDINNESWGLDNVSLKVLNTQYLYPNPNINLTISDISTPNNILLAYGESFETEWKVTNTGSDATSTFWYDGVAISRDAIFDESDVLLGDGWSGAYDLSLQAGESYTVRREVNVNNYVSYFGEGQQYLLFITDAYKNQRETDETDNVVAVPAYLILSDPNLEVTNAGIPTTITAGEMVEISWAVTNKGSQGVSLIGEGLEVQDAIFLSNDEFLDETDIFLNAKLTPSDINVLIPGQSYTNNINITLPEGNSGNRYLLFVTDFSNKIKESEENNVKAFPFQLITPNPNLIITEATAPATATQGEYIYVSWTVENQGTAGTVSYDWYDNIYFSKDENLDDEDILVNESYVFAEDYDYDYEDSFYPALPLFPNYYYTSSGYVPIPLEVGGSGYLIFKTDAYNYENETDEDDNIYSIAINIQVPNLTISNPTPPPSAAILGQTIAVSWQVNNTGTVSAAADWYDSVYISDDQILDSSDTYVTDVWTGSNTPLGAGASYIINQNIFLPQTSSGNRYLLFVADNYNYQGETNESDNVIATPISLSAPDLVISSVTAPSTGIVNGTINISWTVNNSGQVQALTDWTDYVYLSSDNIIDSSDRLISYQYIYTQTPLAAGGSYSINQTVTLPGVAAGNYYLLFKADGSNAQGEINENNNVSAVPITLKAPDLIVQSATAPTSSIANDSILVSWTVTNQGLVDAPADWSDYIYFSTDNVLGNDIYITDQYISTQTPLPAGSSYTIDRSITLPNRPAGDYYLLFVADGYNAQSETNEGNNFRAVPIKISVPDLILSKATAPTSGNLGESINVSWTVLNPSTVTASADWTDRVYISTDAIWDSFDTQITSESITSQTPLISGNSYTINKNITLPNQAPVGSGYLLFRTDANLAQGETDETNNVKAIPFTVNAPNLGVSSATTPESTSVGANINVSWTVTNSGTIAANADWYDSIYISNDQIFDDYDQYITSRWAGSNTPVVAGGSYTATQNITIPTTTTGNRYLLFVADKYPYSYYYYYYYDNLQGETSETDNVYAVPINISSSDLIVESATAPNSAILGNTVQLTWTVKNQGTGEAPQDWYDYVYISSNQTFDSSDILVTSELISTQTPLLSGANYTITKNVVLPSTAIGDHYLLFVTDRLSNQGETNENNNTLALPISLSAPNLTVSGATAPTAATSGSTIAVSWTVNNSGTSTANTDWFDYIYVSSDTNLDSSDTFVTSESITTQTPLADGGSYTISRNITLPNTGIGNRYLLFVADGSNNQGETNEGDNVRAVPIQLTLPDLVVTATAPNTASLNGTIAVSWTVTNQGSIEAATDWSDRVYLSNDVAFDANVDTLITTESIATQTPLAAGNSYTINRNITITNTGIGNRYLIFVADHFNNQGETNEVNNTVVVPITITAPDLIVEAATSPEKGILGETIEVSWTVKNQGAIDAPADWSDSVYLSNDQILDATDVTLTTEGITTQTPLAANASYTITKNLTLPNTGLGTRYLLFATDRSNNQGETDETNNIRVVPITLEAPDLVVSAATNPTTVNLGQNFDVTWTVTNQSTTQAPKDWSDLIYISNDSILDNSDTLIRTEAITTQTPLAAGGNYTVTRNINLPNTATGNRYLLFVADGNNNQPETDNTNNIQSVAITVNAPDLIVNNITAPVEVISGQSVEISWTVKNQGTADTVGNWTDRVYLDLDTTSGLDQLLGSYEYDRSLAVGNSITRSQLINIPITLSGNYRVVVITDSNRQILEGTQNESNNTTIDDVPIQIKQAPLPNLQVSNVTAPLTAFSSQDTVITWTVTNTGNGATSTPIWNDGIYLSLDKTIDNTDIFLASQINSSYLNAGESYTSSRTVSLPQGIDANYYFLVKTDINNNVFEFNNEGDNFGISNATEINLTPPPDLRVTTVNAPNGAFSGQPMTLSWTVTNMGEERTLETAWADRIFMSVDNVLDSSDRNLGTINHTGVLNTGENYTASTTVNLPIGVEGNFFFFVRTDINNQVYEHIYENNNASYDTTSTKITLTPPPDLEVESITVANNARSGGNLSINYRVTNFGATETPASTSSWTDTFYLSTDNELNTATDIRLGSVNRYGILNAGDSYDGVANFALSNTLTGTYYIFAVTDDGDRVFELDNNNNILGGLNQVQIVSQSADLVVSSATIPSTGEAGKTIKVQWTVKNQGIGDTIVNSWIDRIVASTNSILGDGDDINLASFNRTGILNPNGTYSRNESITLPFTLEGNYQLFVVTDGANNVYETSDENNNAFNALALTITRQTPDLQVTQITAPTTGESGTSITINWTVANLGVARTNSNAWYDEVYLSLDGTSSSNDIRLGSVYHSGLLEPASNYTASGTFKIPVDLNGNYSVLVRTDQDNNVIEGALENNNDKASSNTITISLSPVTDLTVQSVDAPEQAIAGQPLSLTWTVVNNGVNTGQNWYDAVYLSRDQIFDRNSDVYLGYRNQTGGLDSGDSYTITQNFNLPRGLAGLYYVFMVTDGGNSVYERTGESNNTNYDGLSTEIILPSPADLVVGTITIPSNGIPGQSATISYSVVNQGANEAIGTWEDTVYISQDAQWDVNDVFFGRVSHTGPVSAGGSYNKTVTATLPGVATGDYYVIVRSDIRNNLPETSETNNIGASLEKFTLDVESLNLGTPDTGVLGQKQSVYYRVDVPAGETLLLELDSEALNGFNELYVSFEKIPDRTTFDFASIEPFNPDPRIVIPTTEAGTYYIRAFGNQVSNSSPNFNIKAELVEFSVFDTSYGQGGNVGNLTLKINGAKFDRSVVARLVDEVQGEREAVNIFYEDSTELYATFDLKGLAPGFYDVIFENSEGTEIIVNDGLEVVAGGGSQIIPQVDAPDSVARNRTYPFTVTWGNTGLNDGVIPVLLVENTVPFGFSPGDTSAGSSYTFLGQNTNGGPPGILRPGQSETRTFFSYSNNQPGNYSVSVNRIYKNLEAFFDWNSLRESLTPAGMTDEEFEPIFNQLIAQVGTTNGDYLRMLSENSILLPEELGSSDDVGALLALELKKARAAVSTSISGILIAKDLNVDLSGRTVIVTNTETSEQFETITLNDGSFTLVNLSPGTYTYQVGSGAFESAPPTTTITSGEVISGLSLEIGNGATIMGEVENENNQPISKALIGVYQNDELIAATQADSDGNFKFTGLEAGTYIVRTYLPDSLESFTNEVTVAANETLTFNLSNTETFSVMLSRTPNNVEPLAFEVEESSLRVANAEIPDRDPLIGEIEGRIRQALSNAPIAESIFKEAVNNAISRAGEVTPESLDSIVNSATNLYFDLLEGKIAHNLILAAVALVGGNGGADFKAVQELYTKYFNSTSPNDIIAFKDGSVVSNYFKNNAVIKDNIDTITNQVSTAIKDLYVSRIFDKNHSEITQLFSLNSNLPNSTSLTIPAQDLLNTQGAEQSSGKWDFKEGLALALAGSNNNGDISKPGSPLARIPDFRQVKVSAKVTIPASSNQAQLTFDINVTIGDTVDFDRDDIYGEKLEQVKFLEQNGRAFSVPFTSEFKVDLKSSDFSVNLKDDPDDKKDDPDDKDDKKDNSKNRREDKDDRDEINRPTSVDPNDIIGPQGFGEQRWITASYPLAYTIRFENDPIFATAPAQTVRITQQLDNDLDFRSFRVGDFGFGEIFVDVPDNRAFYQTRLDLVESLGIFVDVSTGINIETGEIFWEFTSIDPTTGEPPIEALKGFLPPNLSSPQGEGFVNYTIRPKRNVTTGTVIDAQATIIFDINEPISTPPIFNTLDAGKPSSTLNPLPTSVAPGEFVVSWSGGDDNNGSGIAYYTVYVSDNGSAFTPWLTQTTLTEASYIGEVGHTYAFKVVATDNAGNTQEIPPNPGATTQILETVTNIAPILAANNGLTLNEASTGLITLTQLQVTDTDNSPTELTYTITGLPTQGIILLNGTQLGLNSTFTQADINNNLLSYAHNGSETTNDSFSFTVSDGAGGTISTTSFNITVNPVNDAPFVNQTIPNFTLTEEQPFNFTLAANTFSDIDLRDTLTYSTNNLPNWLNFNAATQTFSGTPTLNDSGIYSLTVIATDSQGASVNNSFQITVLNLLKGGANNDTLSGTSNDDVLDGGLGGDRLIGKAGNDLYIVDSNRDVVIENASEGQDKIQSSVSYTLPANVEDLILTGTANINGTGNELDNTITGNSGNNLLKGLAGNDSLIGGNGNDTLVGGAGNDTLTGGEGNDQFLFGSGAVFAESAFGVDTITDFTKGSDKIVLSKLSFVALLSPVNSNLLTEELAIINVNVAEETAVSSTQSAKIIYNSSTGNLLYNQNGNVSGLGSGGLLATLTTIPQLDNNDFLITT
ncbi:CARDB domain-containing protein [Gloeothece verrucosa]|nr:CARDB domain-containing protein [Gloeothece verrucosa]